MSTLINIKDLFDLSKNKYSYLNDLIIIGGPTCVGKSKIAIQLAKKIDGVLINADSIQVYKDLRLLSARPTLEDEKIVPHFLYGYVKSQVNYSVGKWLNDLNKTLKHVKKIQKTPILVGGSGLYLNSIIKGLVSIPKISEKIKKQSVFTLNKLGIEKFRQLNFKIDPIFVNKNIDQQRLIRAYSVYLQTNKNMSFWYSNPRKNLIKKKIYPFLIKLDRDLIYKNCETRFDDMLDKGAIEEVKLLKNSYIDQSLPIMKSLGVKWLIKYLSNEVSLEMAIKLSKRDTRRYVKRQITWFSHNYIPYKIINL
ncbi:tRNA (adenosine(37)-N6)-dimethylallyltransferase MiaA [bacterium]|nr:tRNA (adenosine(37)-N6)-dimethylallyltransferase MiaA [bacterium]